MRSLCLHPLKRLLDLSAVLPAPEHFQNKQTNLARIREQWAASGSEVFLFLVLEGLRRRFRGNCSQLLEKIPSPCFQVPLKVYLLSAATSQLAGTFCPLTIPVWASRRGRGVRVTPALPWQMWHHGTSSRHGAQSRSPLLGSSAVPHVAKDGPRPGDKAVAHRGAVHGADELPKRGGRLLAGDTAPTASEGGGKSPQGGSSGQLKPTRAPRAPVHKVIMSFLTVLNLPGRGSSWIFLAFLINCLLSQRV